MTAEEINLPKKIKHQARVMDFQDLGHLFSKSKKFESEFESPSFSVAVK